MSFVLNRDDETLGGNTANPPGRALFCESNPQDRASRRSLERAVRYVRKRGALPIAVAGNDAMDRSANDDCDALPAETPGVVAVSALDINSTLLNDSNYGAGVVDTAAPSGSLAPLALDSEGRGYFCGGTITTSPGNSYICGGQTSIATPHVSGVAALIISRFGHVGPDGDMKMPPGAVEDILLGSAIDIGAAGNDMCYGAGRVDALRAVLGDTNIGATRTSRAAPHLRMRSTTAARPRVPGFAGSCACRASRSRSRERSPSLRS